MRDTAGLNIREIFHRDYGICQLVYHAATRTWIGINEKKQSVSAPDRQGYPDLEKLTRPKFLYTEQLSYLEILNPYYKPDAMLLSLRRKSETVFA